MVQLKRMKKFLRNCAFVAALLMLPSGALAQAKVFDADNVMFCSDGEFDWISGQSLYDFVILTKDDGRFLISYLGIPHPGFETRSFNNAWMKTKGRFSAKREAPEQKGAAHYQLVLDIDGSGVHQGDLKIDEKGNYTYRVTPQLPLEYVTSKGLCWDSLSDEPEEIRRKTSRRR